MARFLTLMVALSLIVVAGGPVGAQGPSPGRSPLPFKDYVTRLDELGAASRSAFSRLAPSTPAEIAVALGEIMALGESDLVSLREIVPEPCYAAAHEEIVAYRASVVELTEAGLPLMAESPTTEDVAEIIERIDAEVFARHPAAYTEAPEAVSGFSGSHRNILAALMTCPDAVIPDPAAETRRIELPAAGVAITLAAEWQAIDESRLDVDTVLAAYRSDRHGACLLQRVTAAPVTLMDVLDDFIPTGYWAGLPEGYSVDQVETKAGTAARLTYWEGRSDLEARFWNVIYLIPTADGLFGVQCLAEEGVSVAPEDDWLSIAQSFEVLAETP